MESLRPNGSARRNAGALQGTKRRYKLPTLIYCGKSGPFVQSGKSGKVGTLGCAQA